MNNSKDLQGSDSHEVLMGIIKHPKVLQDKIMNFISEEREIVDTSLSELIDLTYYLRMNWRGLTPPLVAFALSIVLRQTDSVIESSHSIGN